MDDQGAADRVARVESLLEELESLSDRVAQEQSMELVQAMLDLYGEGLHRVMAGIGERQASALAEDELVSHLLLLHDLHPVPLETRVQDALEGVRPYLDSHGGGVELLGVDEGVARLRMNGSCNGCPSSTMTLKLAIEDAIHKAAPDIERVEAEGVSEPEPGPPPLLQIEVAGGPPEEEPAGAWAMAGTLAELSSGGTVVKDVAGDSVLFVKLERTFYAYRPACPGCREWLAGAPLQGAELTCSGCGRRYDVRRAGRCLDEPDTYLEPLPLLTDESGLVKVALGAAVA